jgi:hypothetical protein
MHVTCRLHCLTPLLHRSCCHSTHSIALTIYCYMVHDLPEHPVGSQRGSRGTSVIVRSVQQSWAAGSCRGIYTCNRGRACVTHTGTTKQLKPGHKDDQALAPTALKGCTWDKGTNHQQHVVCTPIHTHSSETWGPPCTWSVGPCRGKHNPLNPGCTSQITGSAWC